MGRQPFSGGGAADFPIDGGAEVLQAGENSMLMQAMKQKEEQMTVIGSAVLANRGRYIQSAETARLNTAGEYATLADISIALSQAMTEILRLFALWGGKNADKITFKFNSDFEIEPLNSQDLVSWMGAVQSGFMSWETFYYNMNQREAYPAGWTLEQEQEAIKKGEEERVKKLDNEVVKDRWFQPLIFLNFDRQRHLNFPDYIHQLHGARGVFLPWWQHKLALFGF